MGSSSRSWGSAESSSSSSHSTKREAKEPAPAKD
jgi:hypothetical protein